MQHRWQGVVNQILYVIQFQPDLSTSTVEHVVRVLTDPRRASQDPATYVVGIREALSQADPLDTVINTRFTEDQLRPFLAQVLAGLEAAQA
jgi:hypothetical protein